MFTIIAEDIEQPFVNVLELPEIEGKLVDF